MTATQPQITNTETSTLESMNMTTTATQQSHPEISHGAPMEVLKGMRHVPLPLSVKAMSLEKAESRLAKATEEYLAKREQLDEVSQELDRLRKTHRALQEQGRSAEKAWRKSFMEGTGKQTKSMMEQQEQQTKAQLSVQRYEEMIGLQEPKVEWTQIHAALARRDYLRAFQAVKEIRAYGTMVESMGSLLTGEAAEPLRRAFETMFSQVADDVYNNSIYMAQFKVNTTSQPGKSIRYLLSQDDNRTVDHEIQKQQLAGVGELVLKLLPKPQENEDQEDMRAMPALDCEGGPEIIQSGMRIKRRLRELEAEMASAY